MNFGRSRVNPVQRPPGGTDAPERSSLWNSYEWNVLLVIALAAALGLGWLAPEVSVVQHRRAVRAQLEASGGKFYVAAAHTFIYPMTTEIRAGDPGYRISTIRTLIGDAAIQVVEFDQPLNAKARKAIEAFPEAWVGAADPREAEDSPLPRRRRWRETPPCPDSRATAASPPATP